MTTLDINSISLSDSPLDPAPSASPSRARTATVRMVVASVLTFAIAAFFWIDSRYPALLKKLSSGASIHMIGRLSFDALMPVTPGTPLVTRIGHTAVNWGYTNRIGMTFGLLFGAALLTLLPALGRRRFHSEFANTALGAALGTPLGVCANCVAPIGRSLFDAGASPSTMLAAMISSPTLNVVVLIMAFALLPLPIAIIRLAAPLLLLALIPFLVRRLVPAASLSGDAHQANSVCAIAAVGIPARSFLKEGLGVFRDYFLNLGKLALRTVPWMILAGLLGAVAAELLPATAIPAHVTVLGVLTLALIGTFLPVPIAFDVALAFLLLTRGVPAPYAATLACTLGAFSIYPLFIVGRSLSWRVACSVFEAVVIVGMLAGLATSLLS